jgi:hypothetical protein
VFLGVLAGMGIVKLRAPRSIRCIPYSKKNRTNGASGRLYAVLCSIGSTEAHHTGHTGRDGPFRPFGLRPEDAAKHQERRAWGIGNLAILLPDGLAEAGAIVSGWASHGRGGQVR